MSKLSTWSDRLGATGVRGARRVAGQQASLAMFCLAIASCNRGEMAPLPSPAESSAPVAASAPSPAESIALPVPPPSASAAKNGAAPFTTCASDAECRLFSDSCSACSCRPLAKKSPDPVCTGRKMSCVIDPCQGQPVTCRKGNCIIGVPLGDAAAPDATTAAPDGAASATKSADASSASTTSDAASTTKTASPSADASAARDH